MFYNIIKDDNSGADISILGTAWIFLVFLACVGVLDVFIISYTKEQVVELTKSMEICALATYFDHENAFEQQYFSLSSLTEKKMTDTFANLWNNKFSGVGSGNKSLLKSISYDKSEIAINVTSNRDGLTFLVTQIKFAPKKLIKTSGTIPLFGGNVNDYSNDYVKSSVQTKIALLR